MERPHRTNRLATYLDMSFFSLTMSFVEESAAAFGMEAGDTTRLRLASEELFTYLAESDQKGNAVSVEAYDGWYYVGVKFLLKTAPPEIPISHPPGKGALEPGEDLADMGLIIASRFVDRLNVLHDSRSGYGVGLTKEKTYPGTEAPAKAPVRALTQFRVGRPETETLKYFVRQVTAYYPAGSFPVDFSFPAKVADMVAEGHYRVLVATDGGADVAGGILWRTQGTRTIEAFGPYLFDQPPEHGMSEALVDGLLGEVVRTEAICLTDIYPTPELPEGYFELLGSMGHTKADGHKEPWPIYYRQLKEDPGSSVWAHPDLVPFLRQEYDRLYLARDIRLTPGGGEMRPAHPLFSVELDRIQSSATLHLIWDGADAPAILEQHLKMLKAEGFLDIFFTIDLAHAFEANLAPVLIRQGFSPRLIFPHAGEADIVAFQYEGQ